MTFRYAPLLAVAVALAALSGCGVGQRLDDSVAGLIDSGCKLVPSVARPGGCAASGAAVEVESLDGGEPPLYCYETMGDIDCYARPEPRQTGRPIDLRRRFTAGRG
ncbi:MAG: hypothetical protein QF893_09110 [Alphaproteobacteria bacterium]|nr:hypothetical protein [Alphaproteobacteria bacterium]